MYGTMLFVHLIGLIAWLGGWLAIIGMLLLNRQSSSADTHHLAARAVRIFSWIAYPSAFLVLISGVYMIVQLGLDDKPIWLIVMERGGGMVILLSLLIPTLMGRKVIRRLSASQAAPVRYSGYVSTLSILMVVVAAIVLIVSMKL